MCTEIHPHFVFKQMEAEREDRKQREALREEERKRLEAQRQIAQERLVCALSLCYLDKKLEKYF